MGRKREAEALSKRRARALSWRWIEEEEEGDMKDSHEEGEEREGANAV